MAEMALAEIIHTMPVLPAIEGIRQQHRVVDRADIDAKLLEQQHIVFQVLPDLEHTAMLKQWLHKFERVTDRQLVEPGTIIEIETTVLGLVTDGDVAGTARRRRHREADEIGAHRIEAGGLGVECELAQFARFANPTLEIGPGGDNLVFLPVDRLSRCQLSVMFDHRGGRSDTVLACGVFRPAGLGALGNR